MIARAARSSTIVAVGRFRRNARLITIGNSASLRYSTKVSSTTYMNDGQAERVDVEKRRGFNVTPSDGSEFSGRKAMPFNKSAATKLTPTMQSFLLTGKVALVTGGARGLGWNMSQALAEAGAQSIAILDRKPQIGDQAAADLHKSTKIPVQFYDVDVTDAQAVQTAVQKVQGDLGTPEIVVNSAGIVDSNIKAEGYDIDMFRRLLDINLTGSFIVSQAAAQCMISSGTGGSIVFLSSIAGSRVLHPQQQCAYNASKAGVTHLAKCLAAEWASHGIRVNTIAPGYMDTDLNKEASLQGQKQFWASQTPMARLGQPDELNGLAVFLASDASRFVTGAHIYADGGYAVY